MLVGGKKLKGVVVPLVTPLEADGSLDAGGLENMINHVIRGGVAAVFALGSTGEGPALSWKTRRDTVCESVRIAGKRVPVLANVSCDSGAESVEFARFCGKAGADGVVASPPCYLPNSGDELVDFFRALASESPCPVYAYNMPELTKVSIPPDALGMILELPNIAGIKDSSGDLDFFRRLVKSYGGRGDLSVFMGPDALTKTALELGADGGVNSGANLRPEIYSGLFRAVSSGDKTGAESFQKEIIALQEVYKVRPGSPGVICGLKRALAEKGLIKNILAFPGTGAE